MGDLFERQVNHVDQANQHHETAQNNPAIKSTRDAPQTTASWINATTQASAIAAPASQKAAAAARKAGEPPEPDQRPQKRGFSKGCGAIWNAAAIRLA
jgi:hypothetical protein